MKFYKYHALGNDYLVINSQDLNSQDLNSQGLKFELTPEKIQKICDRRFGIGSDGILLGTIRSETNRFSLRILTLMVVKQKKVVMDCEYFPAIYGIWD